MGALPCIILLTIFLGILVIFLIPVSLGFDSRQQNFTVRWMNLSITKRLEKKGPRRPEEKPQREKKRFIKTIGVRLLKDRVLFFELLQKGYHSMIDVLRSVCIREVEATFSTPDPLWNGVFYGILNNIHSKNVSLTMNFQNINYVKGWLQFHPYKIVKVVAGLLVRLPYRRIVKTVFFAKKQ